MGNICGSPESDWEDNRSIRNSREIRDNEYLNRTQQISRAYNNNNITTTSVRQNVLPQTQGLNRANSSSFMPTSNQNETTLSVNPKLVVYHNKPVGEYGEGKLFKGRVNQKQVTFIKFTNKQDILNEISILEGLGHTNVIRHHFNHDSASHVYIISECIETSLKSHVTTIGDYKDVVSQLIEGLLYLQNLEIAHLKLSTSNIFMVKFHRENVLKFGDFSNAVRTNGIPSIYPRAVSVNEFSAPEMKMYGLKNLLGADIYSVGAIILNVFSRGSLYSPGTPAGKIVRTNKPTLSDILCSDLIQKMAAQRPNERLDRGQIKDHPYFWDHSKIVLFLIEIFKLNETGDKFFRQCLHHNSFRVTGRNQDWTLKLETEVLEAINAGKKKYDEKVNGRKQGNKRKGKKGNGYEDSAEDLIEDKRNNIVSLIQTMRNVHVHAQSAEIIIDIMGTPEKFVNYWFNKFPHLLLHLYNAKLSFEK